MGFVELFLLALGLSMDAFAVSVCIGLNMQKEMLKKALIVGLYFGIFQAVMPLIGYFAARLFSNYITSYDHWIAFALLVFLGFRMISGGIRHGGSEIKTNSLKPGIMLPFAFATSIDALAVGISLAFLGVRIVPAVSTIGVTTLVLSMAGVKIGGLFGTGFKKHAEIAGGIILILIGVKILLEHLGAISF